MKTSHLKTIGSFFLLLLAAVHSARAGAFALVADGGNHRVAQFYVSGTTWTYMTNFVDNNTPMSDASGTLPPLVAPTSVVQDENGLIYVSDQNGAGNSRVLRFSTNGVFIDMVGTNGLNGYNVPGSGVDDMTLGPDGNIYGTLAFGTANNQILKFNVATTNWSVLYSNSATLSTPRGLSFAPDGNLYVNSRGNARMLVFDLNGNLLRTNATFSGQFTTTPMGNRWDAVGNRFICTAGNGNSVICTCTTNGVLSMVTGLNPSGGPGNSISTLGAVASGTNIFYTPYKSSGRIYLCNNAATNTVTTVDTGTTPLLNNATFFNFATGFGVGALQSVALNVTRTNMIIGTYEQAQFIGNYVAQSGVNIITDPGTVLSSSDPGVVTISAGGLVTAVGIGTATITASNSGLTNTLSITVVPLVTTLIHRYSFTSDASDSVGSANGVIYGSDYTFMNGQLVLLPTGPNDYNFVDCGPNLISSNDVLTIETWASFNTNYPWARLFDFGNNNGVSATSSLFFTPHNASGGSQLTLLTAAGETDLDAAGLDGQTNVHIVAVVHPLAGYMKLYINGVLATQTTNISGQDLANIVDNYDYLGLSQYYADPSASLSYDELRIYSGVLDATNVAIDYAAGPNNVVADPGSLQTLSVVINTNMLQQGQQQITVSGNFANVSGVPLNNFGNIGFTSSDTNVLTVSSSGVIQAVGFGTATITVTYGNQSVTQTITSAPLPLARFLVTDGGNNRVLQYDAIGTNWVLDKVFASGTIGGVALAEPTGLAQDANGNVYVSEGVASGRLLKFDVSGNYLGTLGTAGVDFTGQPGYLATDAQGNVYMSTPFSANNILEYNVTSNAWSVFVPTTDNANYTLSNPIGIAFGPDGNLYVCNRGAFNAANQSVLEFDKTGAYVPNPNTGLNFATGLTGPQGLSWDAANNRFLVTVAATQIGAIGTNGAFTSLSGAVAQDALSALAIGTNVYFSDYSGSGVYALTSPASVNLVAGGIIHAHQMIQTILPPNLNISQSGNNILISWPYSSSTANLEFSDSLNPANWQDVGVTPTQTGNQMQVTLPVSGGEMYFRLSN